MSDGAGRKTALIGDIGRNCVHDGPGIRTTVFFKGCPMRCPWCHNPEFLSAKPEIAFYVERCIGCGDCLQVCPEAAIVDGDPVRIDRNSCTGCGLCAEACPANALELVGRKYGIDELLEVVLRDRFFYESSGGGVTLSGGEPTAQLSFIGPLLQRLKQQGIHTAIETNGFFDWEAFAASCLDYLDLILFDVKIADPVSHRKVTGVDNAVILANLKKLIDLRPEAIVARIPLIPDYTATEENIKRLAAIFHDLKIRRYSLLPYHPFGISKAEKIGLAMECNLPNKMMLSNEVPSWMQYFRKIEFITKKKPQ